MLLQMHVADACMQWAAEFMMLSSLAGNGFKKARVTMSST